MEVFNDYKLIIVPPEPVLTMLTEERTRLMEKYSIANPGTSFPQLILTKFQQTATAEAKFINRFHIIGESMPPVNVHLYNFSAYPFHTIFVAILNPVPLNSLVKSIRKNAGKLINNGPGKKASFMSVPHLTIARKLSVEKFNEAWNACSVRKFDATFIADQMILVKRDASTGKFVSLAAIHFRNKPLQGEQIKLFN